jgi:hypothetical protein
VSSQSVSERFLFLFFPRMSRGGMRHNATPPKVADERERERWTCIVAEEERVGASLFLLTPPASDT